MPKVPTDSNGKSYMDGVFDKIKTDPDNVLRVSNYKTSNKTSKYLTSKQFNKNLTKKVFNDDHYEMQIVEYVRQIMRPKPRLVIDADQAL